MSSDSSSGQKPARNNLLSPQKSKLGSNINNLGYSSPINQSENQLQKQNRNLRKKLKQLNRKLDQQIEKAVQSKMKAKPHANFQSKSTPQSQSLELQNAYKIIDRLQKTVKDFQSKQSYQVSVRRIMDLQSIIKKKQAQAEQFKGQIKTMKKTVKDKDRYIAQLVQSSKKMTNPTQDKQVINKLKQKLRKVLTQNQSLRKKQLQKHHKLVSAERKLVQMQQTDETPIGRQQKLLNQLQEYKKKHSQAMQRVQRQNIYIVKLNERLSIIADRKQGKMSQGAQKEPKSGLNRSLVSKSVDDIPDYSRQQKKIRSGRMDPNSLLQHLPSPQTKKLKRY